MSRLQTIENALIAINETLFQELCDHFLSIKNDNYSLLARLGSQTGKQKTIKGTPDSLFMLPNGKYMFVEHSTNITAGVTKLEEDIQKCLESKKTKIAINLISEIIICINFNLKTEEIEQLRKLVSHTYIRLTIYTLDSLAIELHFNHRDLAHEYLGLPLDTGQIVSINKFITEYNRASKNIATPLDNIFLHREQEVEQLKSAIEHSDFIILTGPPGIGKTKLSLETIDKFLKQNLSYHAYCVSYKQYALLDDMYQYLKKDGDFILFVDDANRIDAFNQITGFYKSDRNGKLKIIITVRDYAYQEIGRLCQEFMPVRIDLTKLTDEQIVDIIKSDSFEIKNTKYQQEIVRIADGNPRLAIMTALLAKKHQNLEVLKDVSDLFEQYFATFSKDQEEFSEDINIKCLGIISFFHTLPYKDKATVSKILNHFGISYDIFIDVIDKLDKLELVEIQYEHVKVPEQNIAIYFFYRAFIKDDLLSFETLLQHYFETNKSRLKECIISANNTFGGKNVMDKVKPHLIKFWRQVESIKEKALSMLETFWFYLPLPTLEYILTKINNLPEPELTEYVLTYKTNDFIYNHDEIIDLLGEFFRSTEFLKDAIELATEYVKKEPHHLPEIIHKIKERLIYDWRDEQIGFFRQEILIDHLISGLEKGDDLLSQMFFELSKSFLGFKFQHTEGGRNMSVAFYFYPVPNTPDIRRIRTKIWKASDNYFRQYPKQAFELLVTYARVSPDTVRDIMQFDVDFLIPIIETQLDPISFEHCKYVNDQIRWLKRNGIINPSYQKLKERFTNSVYELFLKIDWDHFRDKEMFGFPDYRKYSELKQNEIRNSFIFENESEVEHFYNNFIFLKQNSKNDWNYNNSLEIIIDTNMKHDFHLGLKLLSEVIEDHNKASYVPRIVLRENLQEISRASLIKDLIEKNEFQDKFQWQFSYYDYLDERNIKYEDTTAILQIVESINKPITIQFSGLVKFLRLRPDFFIELLQLIVTKNAVEKVGISLWVDFFEENFDYFKEDFGLIKSAYLQQLKIQNYLDFESKAFQKILNASPAFIIDYFEALYIQEQHTYSDDTRRFGFIWDIEQIEIHVLIIFELFIEKHIYYGISEACLNILFQDLTDTQKVKADQFLINYLKANATDPKKMNIMVDIVRNSRKELFKKLLLKYVSLNQNVKDFSEIWWRGNGGTYSGDVVIGDIEAADWRNVLSILEESDLGIRLLPIKRYVTDTIDDCLKSGDRERKLRFLDRY